MKSRPHTLVLILGAGPAGLSLARELGIRGIDYLILERADQVGATFARMTESTTFGPWMNNTLPGGEVPWSRMLRRTLRADYTHYLQEYAEHHGLRVKLGAEVMSAHDTANGFLVRLRDGEVIRSQVLVNATGIFTNPFQPQYPGSDSSCIPTLHSAAYRSAKTVTDLAGRQRARVLIVGSGLSAGEILEELHDAGHHVHLSHRGHIETWPSPLEEAVTSPLTFLWEEISLQLGLKRPSNLRPRLRRGRQYSLLSSGKVPTHPEILTIGPREVTFVDRSSEAFDVILFATGYRPALKHLAPMVRDSQPWVIGLESAETTNLFFLGLPNSRTFRSEFLRGIREDAPYLANLLERRLSPPRLHIVRRTFESLESAPQSYQETHHL